MKFTYINQLNVPKKRRFSKLVTLQLFAMALIWLSLIIWFITNLVEDDTTKNSDIWLHCFERYIPVKKKINALSKSSKSQSPRYSFKIAKGIKMCFTLFHHFSSSSLSSSSSSRRRRRRHLKWFFERSLSLSSAFTNQLWKLLSRLLVRSIDGMLSECIHRKENVCFLSEKSLK